MAYTYEVQAKIIQASKYKPTGREHILLDTQILLWMYYPKFSSPMLGSERPAGYQLKTYPSLLKSLLQAKSALYYTGLSLPELFHQIERFECTLHSYETKTEMKPKHFRHAVDDAMQRIVAEVRAIWETLHNVAHLIPVTLNERFLQDTMSQYGSAKVDGYDRFMLEVVRTAGIQLWILSDDGDMACIPEATVITENQSVLSEAYNKRLVIM